MEFDNKRPIYMQIIEDLKLKLINGSLAAGQKLPSTRDLAIEYQVNPNTAMRIYNEMEAMGLCFTKRGLGTFVTDDSSAVVKIRAELGEQLLSDFLNGMEQLGYAEEDIIKLIQNKSKGVEKLC